MLDLYEDSQKKTQEKGKILEENAQTAQEESARHNHFPPVLQWSAKARIISP
jgi:hypothetical protein